MRTVIEFCLFITSICLVILLLVVLFEINSNILDMKSGINKLINYGIKFLISWVTFIMLIKGEDNG